jgi:hypothetical protein
MRRTFIFLCLASLAGCGSSTHDGDDAGSNPRNDGGTVQCGPTTCAAGEVCCNESCGVCTEPGGACDALFCVEDAGADVPCGPTTCTGGQVCCNASCGICTEPDGSCIDLFCADAGTGVSCGDGTACGPGEYCDYEAASQCGGAGSCTPRPEICTEDCPQVCGCDGEDYCNTCVAQRAGVDVAHDGPCGTSASCDAMDARGIGLCALFLGVAWNGSACEAINCTCEGADCGSLYATQDECTSAHADCAPVYCGGWSGDTCAADEFCDFEDGTYCDFADGSGVCAPIPESCDGEPISPVCGCNGETYDNACLAHMADTDVQLTGACGSRP